MTGGLQRRPCNLRLYTDRRAATFHFGGGGQDVEGVDGGRCGRDVPSPENLDFLHRNATFCVFSIFRTLWNAV